MSENKTAVVRILSDVKESLDRLANEKGIDKQEIVSRMIKWLSEQDKTLQAIILGQIDPKDEAEVLGLIHKRLAQKIVEQLPQDLGKQIAEKKKKASSQ